MNAPGESSDKGKPMIDDLVSFIRELAARQKLDEYDEATTQQCLVLPVFRKLGWDDTDPKEVTTQYSVGSGRCDYALSVSSDKKVLCEVKTPSENDLSKHERQLVNYAFERGAELAVLTNGVSWWFYLPMLKGPWERRKFFTVDIRSQSPEDAAERLEDFLGKGNVTNGKAVSKAEELQRGREKKERIDETLPDAWRELVEGPDEMLLNLLCGRVEKMCGFKPGIEQVTAFLKKEKTPYDTPQN